MELWDVYDRDRKPTGRLHERGKEMNHDDYHIAVRVWIVNSKGECLISKRSPEKMMGEKKMAGRWEPTGGSVVAGEDSFTGALREVREELGIALDPSAGRLIASERFDYPKWRNPGFFDTYVFRHDCPISDVVLQEGETCDAKWASADEIRAMKERGELCVDSEFMPPFDI